MDELGHSIREAADQITVALGGPSFALRRPGLSGSGQGPGQGLGHG
jgi:hypothetical protein